MDVGDAVQHVVDGYKAAAWAKDVDAFMALYHDDVRVFDGWGVWSYEGAARWRQSVALWFEALGDDRLLVSFAGLASLSGSDHAVVSTFVTYRAVSSSGEHLRTTHSRITWAMTRVGGRFAIAHEHKSEPLGFADMDAVLEAELGL